MTLISTVRCILEMIVTLLTLLFRIIAPFNGIFVANSQRLAYNIYIYISGLFLERIWNEITMGKAFWIHILQIRKWRMIETAELLQYTSVFSSWMQNIMKSYVIFIAGASLKSLWKNWRKSEQQQTGEKRVALTSHCTKTKK